MGLFVSHKTQIIVEAQSPVMQTVQGGNLSINQVSQLKADWYLERRYDSSQ